MPTFVAAVRGKYEHKAGSEDGGELVGGDKTGKKQALDVLERVFVPDLAIDSAGEDGEIAKVCGAIQELDLGGNKLDSWTPVQAIATQLPKLHWLSLDKLSLAPLDAIPDGFLATFGKLQTLCLRSTGMRWSQVLQLAASMPSLEELHFSSNELTTLQPPPATGGGAAAVDAVTALKGVHSLYLEGNHLDAWEAIAPIAHLPELAVLNLNYNKLTSVPRLGESGGFGKLKHLMLRGNPIADWPSIDALDGFPSLTEARLAELPLTAASSGAVARRTVIARLGKLAALNGSEVRPRERDDAERFYLRAVAQEYPEGGLPKEAVVEAAPDISDGEPKVDEYGRPLSTPSATVGSGIVELKLPETEAWAALQAKHPRWAALLIKHGTHASISGGTKASGGVIANELVEVTMRATSAEAAHLPAATRKLPGGLPVKSVKLIACQLYKLEPSKIVLLYTPPGQEKDIPEELDDDARSLADLGVVSGGTIVIDEK